MADTKPGEEDAQTKKSKLPLIVGLVLALIGGGGGFFAVQSGLLFGGANGKAGTPPSAAASADTGVADVAFVPVGKLVISLGSAPRRNHLLFKSQLEVVKSDEAAVTELLPRVVDVMNTYLRAVDLKDLEDPTALVRLRAQMLRRVQTVVGEGRVRDLLIMEFALN